MMEEKKNKWQKCNKAKGFENFRTNERYNPFEKKKKKNPVVDLKHVKDEPKEKVTF